MGKSTIFYGPFSSSQTVKIPEAKWTRTSKPARDLMIFVWTIKD
jgi:hypothetical protein